MLWLVSHMWTNEREGNYNQAWGVMEYMELRYVIRLQKRWLYSGTVIEKNK